MSDIREAFEKWYLSEIDGDPEELAVEEDGDYFFHVPRSAWRAWQAALQSAESTDPVATLHVSENATTASYRLDPLSCVPLGSHPVFLHPKPTQVSEGWKLVPIEPTEDMVLQGFESDIDPEFNGAFDDLSGCQEAALKARLCYAAMLGAAPDPDHIGDANKMVSHRHGCACARDFSRCKATQDGCPLRDPAGAHQ